MRILKTFYVIVGVDSDNPNDSWMIKFCDDGLNGTKDFAFAKIFRTEQEAIDCLAYLKETHVEKLSRIIDINTAIVKPLNIIA